MKLQKYDLIQAVKRLPEPLKKMLVEFDEVRYDDESGSPVFVRGQLMVAGGYLRAIVAGEKVSDIDVFAPTKQFALGAAKTLADRCKGRIHETEFAYTVHGLRYMVQFIHKWTYRTPRDCIASFDFSICQAVLFQNENGQWDSLVGDEFYQDIAARRLTYLCPVREEAAGGSMLRVLKYYQRGYRIDLRSFGAVMARMVDKLDFEQVAKRSDREAYLAKILTGLLIEVDPNTDPDQILSYYGDHDDQEPEKPVEAAPAEPPTTTAETLAAPQPVEIPVDVPR